MVFYVVISKMAGSIMSYSKHRQVTMLHEAFSSVYFSVGCLYNIFHKTRERQTTKKW